MGLRYDEEKLNQIPIAEVLEALGATAVVAGKKYRCFNASAHNHNDKKPSLTIPAGDNICCCWGCQVVKGGPISVATFAYGSFKEACEYLHESWNIPYLENENRSGSIPKPSGNFSERQPKFNRKKYDFWVFPDDVEERKDIELNKFKYSALTEDEQKMRYLYTYIYRYSLTTDQKPKEDYYASRGIKETPWREICGFLSYDQAKAVHEKLKRIASEEDLEKFKLNYMYGNVITVPSFAPYVNMVDGMMLRLIGRKNPKVKEHQLSTSNLRYPLPFGLTVELAKTDVPIWVTEGHIDAFSLNEATGSAFVAMPGAGGFIDKVAGMFRGHTVFVAFDQDNAGDTGANRLLELFKYAGVTAFRAKWDSSLGKDLGDLHEKGMLKELVQKYEEKYVYTQDSRYAS